jgi:hypothetical protein
LRLSDKLSLICLSLSFFYIFIDTKLFASATAIFPQLFTGILHITSRKIMKRLILLCIVYAICFASFAGLTGIKDIPGDYSTLAEAIIDLNTQGVGSGGITFNVVAGYSETLTAPLSITTTGTSANPIIFQKNGSGANPLLTAYAGAATPSSHVQDGMWNLIGSDYVTIDGIDLYDPNTTNPATMEYGYAMFKASASDGCQYNTIKNCVVTLSRVNNAIATEPATAGSRAINVVNSLVYTQTTPITPTTGAGTNSYNKFYTNTLQNCNTGIALNGYAAIAPFTLGDTGNDIGGVLSTTGNMVLNFGGATGASNIATGIRANNQWGINISWNTVNNNNGSGVNHATTIRGIFAQAGLSSNATITHNNVTISGGGTSSSIYGIDNAIGSSAASNTVEISYNSVTGSYSTATTGAFYAIQNTASAATVNARYNTISGISTPGTGAIYGMALGSPAYLNITNNSIENLTKTGIGIIYGINPNTATVTCQYNTLDGLVCTAPSSTAEINGIYDGGSAVTENYSYNIIRNLTSTGTAIIYGLYIGTANGNKTVQGNHVYNLNKTGGGSIYGITMAYGATDILSDNLVHDFNISGSSSGTIYGIRIIAGSNNSIYNNTINALSNAGGSAGAIYGFYISTATTNNLCRNQVFDLSSGSSNPILYGIYLLSGTTNNVFNNFISDLRTPAANALIPLAGIYVGGGTTNNVFFNSVFLNATSTGTNFGSAALYASSSPILDMRNNVLVNVSAPMGTGVTAAYRRSSNTLTTYSANSNANAFYAGATEDATHTVYFDGTVPYSIDPYKTLVGPNRDGTSFRELPPFINMATTPYNLHLQPASPTYCESGGLSVTSPIVITTDFDGDMRTIVPDVGADEFESYQIQPNPTSFTATAISSQQINLTFNLNLYTNDVVVIWNNTGIFTTPAGIPTIGSPLAGGTVLSIGTTSPVSHTGLTGGTIYYYKAFSYSGTAFSSGVNAYTTASVEVPAAFSAAAISPSQINLAYTLNAQSNDVLIATNSTSSFGVPSNGTSYTAGNTLPTAGTVIYVGPLAAFSHTGLAESTTFYYKIWSVDAFNYYSTTGATANAVTPCGVISTFPYYEQFSSSLGCWSRSEAVAGSTVHWVTTTTDGTHGPSIAQSGTGTYFAKFDAYNGSTAYNPYYLISPSFIFDATVKEVSYYYWLGTAGYQTTPVPLTLQISTNGGSTWNDLYAHTTANSVFGTANTSPWTKNVIRLDAFTGMTVKFRFVSYSNYGDGFTNQGIDEFSVQNALGCPIPILLTATGITDNSSILGWNGIGTSNDIEYGPAGFAQGTGTIISNVSNPYALSGLSSNTAYSYYVRSYCGGPIPSQWAGPAYFTTSCASLNLSFYESFENATFPPACWNNTAINGSAVWARSTGASGNGSGLGSAFANFFNQGQNQVYDLITPAFETNACTVMPYLSFNYAYATYSGSGEVDEMDIYYSTNGGSIWSILQEMPGGATGILNTGGESFSSFIPTESQWGYRMIYLPSGTNRLKFRAISAFGNNLYLDNIQVQYTETARDIEAVSIDISQVVPQSTITPKATVKNNGFSPETFDVAMAIGSYYSTETVSALAPGATQQVSFAPWTNSIGNYPAVVTTYSLCGDINSANNTGTKAIKVMALDKTVYAWTTFDATNNGPLSFNLNDPGTLTEIVNEYPAISYPTAGTWANNVWYATIYAADAPYNLVTFNPATGARTVIGDMGVNINALSYNTANSTLYGLGYDGANSLLYSINPGTAGTNLIGTIASRQIVSLAINEAGIAYAVDQGESALGIINLTTAAYTSIGSIGFDANDGHDMEFDRETGELFMTAFGTTGELRWVDQSTGNTLLIGQFQDGHKLTGLAIPYASDKLFRLNVKVEGLYEGNGLMRTANDESGPHWGAGIADKITVELYSTNGIMVYALSNINMATDGSVEGSIPSAFNGDYYILIKHRNSIPICSKYPVSFNGSTIYYSFDEVSKAFGNNMQVMEDETVVMFSGDDNQDNLVDTGDYLSVDNSANNYSVGYITEDIDGNGLIDTGDYIAIDNNNASYISAVLPF